MASGDVVRLENSGDTDFVDSYNGRKYRIPAHGQLMVDYDAMCLWLGHPETNDFDPRNRVRLQEYDRLRIRYGVSARALEFSTDHVPFDDAELFRSMRPPLEVFDMANNRILTVADDPDGDLLAVPSPDSTSDVGLLMARMQAAEQEMSNLRHQLAQSQRTEQALNEAQPIATDAAADVNTSTTANPAKAPAPPARSTTSEDTPTRIRVTNP